MAGRMGHVTSTVQNLTVVSADVENGILAIKGAIPRSEERRVGKEC